MRKTTSLCLALITLLACGAAMAAPTISSISTNASSYSGSNIPKYEKFEATWTIGSVGTAFTDYNPFNPNLTALGSQYYNLKGIKVDASLTSPSGRSISWPAFWYKASDNSTKWMLRFAPTETGTWKYKITVQFGTDTVTSPESTFNVVTSSNHGFIGINSSDTRFFKFSDGTSFFPIGCDMSGYDGTGSAWGTAFPKMKAVGANFSRLFFTSLNIEPYNVGTNKAALKALNNYDMSRSLSVDGVLDLAHQNGIYLEWLLDDSTYIKDQSNQYISVSGRDAPCTSESDFYSSATAREIYKRKLRYWMARWGYSVNLFNIELMNECAEAGGTAAWHTDLGNYIHTYTNQPHMASSSNGSGELQVDGVPWNDASMDFVNYHDYAKYTQGWTIKTQYPLEQLGCTLQFPWEDFAVYADRIARIAFKKYKWNKPLCWSEFGLIFRRPGDSDFPDWDLAYQLDTSGHHVKDGLWAGMMNGMSITHWKLNYVLGTYGGGDKFWVYAPLSNYLSGEDMAGLTQETTYSVSDPVNTSPKVTCSNSKMMAVTMHGPTKAYIYAKNLTDSWFRDYYNAQTSDHYANGSQIPTFGAQSATIKVGGMTPGTYSLETWSTTATTGQPSARTNITVGSDGVATFTTASLNCDAAYKIKSTSTQPAQPPSLTVSLGVDKTSVAPGGTLNYTVTYTNKGTGAAQNTVISVNCPQFTTFVSASNGGTYSSTTGKVTWTISSVAAGGSGTVTFQAKVN